LNEQDHIPVFSGTHGAHEAKKFMKVLHFFYWKDCMVYLSERGASVYGISPFLIPGFNHEVSVSTDENIASYKSLAVEDVLFENSVVAFIISAKEGLTPEQLSLCETILHVRFPVQEMEQYVHYDSKISICFQHYACSAHLLQNTMEGEKYALQEFDNSAMGSFKHRRKENKIIPVDSEDGLSHLFNSDET
jgi:hypothetical protein